MGLLLYSKNMRIGIDARMYTSEFTGIGRYTYELIHHLLKQDFLNEYVLFFGQNGYDSFQPPRPGVKKVLANFRHYSLSEQIGFLKLLLHEKLDLVHFTHFNAPLFYRRPYVVTIHDLTLSYFPGKKMRGLLHRLAYHLVIRNVVRSAQRIIAVSAHTKTDLMRLLGASADKIEVIHHGLIPHFGSISEQKVVETQRKYRLTNPYFLYTGVWRNHKNLVGMIEGFEQFVKKGNVAFDLVLTGNPDPYYPEVFQTISRLKLQERIKTVGLVQEADLAALYKGAVAFVFPSYYEGFGFPPLEAMQCGTPVLASNTSSLPEVCGPQNALYFNPYDPHAIAVSMQQIVEDPTLREKLKQRGLHHVQTFHWNRTATATLNLYQKAHGTAG